MNRPSEAVRLYYIILVVALVLVRGVNPIYPLRFYLLE